MSIMSHGLPIFLSLMLASALLWSPERAIAAPAAIEIERVVAVVRPPAAKESRVVTLSQLEGEARIALVSRGAVLAAVQPLDGPALKAGLEWLLEQLLLDAEATRLQVFGIERAESGAELARFREHFSRPSEYQAFLARIALSEPELEAVLQRTLRVRRYVESRVSRAAQVTEGEVATWLDQHAAELGTRDREAARAHLIEQRVNEEVKALSRDVRARAEVRVLIDFDSASVSSASGGAS